MIYLVEDDENIRKLVVYALESQGLPAEGFENAKSFWEAMKAKKPQLVILDIMLPEEDGVSILKAIRQRDRRLPVIMLTAKSTEYDKVESLNAGADDYITKPFGIMELTARIRAVLRRSGDSRDSAEFFCGPLRINWDRHEVFSGQKPVELTPKEFDILRLLIKNPGIVLTREVLLERIWGLGAEPENRTLDVHIRTLRAKLKESGSLIQTVRGVGYRFDDTVQREPRA